MVIKSFCASRCTTIMAEHSYLNVSERRHAVRQGATSVSLIGHLLWPHLRTTSDRQLIKEPLAVVANLCSICRSDDTCLSGSFFNWNRNIFLDFHCRTLTSKLIYFFILQLLICESKVIRNCLIRR